jgi:hypothetical protein
MANINVGRYHYGLAALDPDQKVTRISAFSNASAPVFWRPPRYGIRMDLETDINTPGQEWRQQTRAALRQRIAQGDGLSVRCLVTQHVLRESFGRDEEAIQAQLDMISALGAAVQEGADVRIVLPGADWRHFINLGDSAIVEREGKVGLYVQATLRSDLVLADESDPSYARVFDSFNQLWEDDPKVLREPREIHSELTAAVDAVREIGRLN